MSEPDLIGSEPSPSGTFDDPATLALIAFPMSLLCLLGGNLLSGFSYVRGLIDDDSPLVGLRALGVTGAALSVAFALFPFVLARRGMARLASSDAGWIGPMLRAAVVLAALAMVLRAVLGALALAEEEYGFASFFSG